MTLLKDLKDAADRAGSAFDAAARPHYPDGRWGAYRAAECGLDMPTDVWAALKAYHAATYAFCLARDNATEPVLTVTKGQTTMTMTIGTTEFAGIIYPTTRAMLDGIAYEYMTAGGINSPAQVTDLIGNGMTPTQAAREAIEGWTLDRSESDDEPSHMDACGYTMADLIAAMDRFFDERPDLA